MTMLGLIGEAESPYITVHQGGVRLFTNRPPTACAAPKSCASGCISYDGEVLTVSPEKCIGCSTCATVCPTCALGPTTRAMRPSRRRPAHRLRPTRARPLGCGELLEQARGRYEEKDRACGMPWPRGRVPPSRSCRGRRPRGGAHPRRLQYCDHGRGRACARRWWKPPRLLGNWGAPMTVRFSGKLPASAKRAADYDSRAPRPCSRKGAALAPDAGVVVAETAVTGLGDASNADAEASVADARDGRYLKVMTTVRCPFYPHRRERCSITWRHGRAGGRHEVDTRLWGHVVIDTDACASCQMCAVFCPTGAGGSPTPTAPSAWSTVRATA